MWTFTGEHGVAKHKDFKVDCGQSGPGGTGSTGGNGTVVSHAGLRVRGGVATGGGGSSRGPDTAELAAGSALLALAAGLGVRALRRRSARRAES